ncbi:hypothetical protein V5O48_004152 [Marasmius crinis-equi]|uniref:Uncharacterized protein n=1 Tax=Marasmius crinis-equi TaxID=585013 RepID=A0ABR3FQV3_9AGAR
MVNRLSQITDSHLYYVTQNLTKASNAPEKNERPRSIARLALEIAEYSDVSKLELLAEASCETGYSAIYYTGKESHSPPEISPATLKKLDELIRTLEDILSFCCAFKSRTWFTTLFLRAAGFLDKRKIKKFRATLRRMVTQDFVPKDWKPISIKETVDEAIRQAQDQRARSRTEDSLDARFA